MEERKKEQHLEKSDCKEKTEKDEEIGKEQEPIMPREAKPAATRVGQRPRTTEYGVDEEMDGQIKAEDDERALEAVDGKEDVEAPAEGVGAEHENDGRKDASDKVNARKRDDEEQDGVPERSLQKDLQDTAVGKADAVDKAVADGDVIIVDGGRRDEDEPEDGPDEQKHGKDDQRLFPLKRPREAVAERKGKVHIQ